MTNRMAQENPLFEVRQESAVLIMTGLLIAGTTIGLVSELFPNRLVYGILTVLLILGVLAAWALAGRNFVASMWLLVFSFFTTLFLAQQWSHHAILYGLLALPSGIATLVIDRKAGLFTAAIASLLIAQDTFSHISTIRDGTHLVALLLIWGMVALITISLKFAHTASLWALSSYAQMHQLLEDARDQSLELKQTQQDLIATNLQLLRLTERLEAIGEIAEEARRTKEEFVANVSHELRTPLNMIIGFTDMITQSPDMYHVDLPPSLLADLAVIQRNSQHLTKLVDDVLDLSQIEAGQLALKKEWVNVREIIESAYVAVQPLFVAKGLYLHLDLPPTIPALFCDSTRLRQVWLNLLSNAGRFTEEGGVRIRMWVEESHVIVSVADSGPGISPEDQARIFEPFQQVDGSLRRRFGGNGLGLSISKRFVELHHGKIWLESTLGKGTTVFVSLPWQEKPSELPSNASRWVNRYARYEPRTRQSKAPLLIPPPRLIVLESGNILARLLTRYYQGAEIVALRTWADACFELRRSPAQALIVNEPYAQNASVLTEKAAALPYGTPVIACWMPGIEQVAEQLGVLHYLMKPVMRTTLLSTLENLECTVKTILVVDDDADALQFFARVLLSAGRGYRVLRASDGQHALALLRERQPDLLLLDLIMRGMDGFTVLQEKSEDRAICDIPVIVISASDPLEEPIMTNFLTATRSRAISFDDLTSFIHIVGHFSQLPEPSVDPTSTESVSGSLASG
jgi:signal transduction histidine kinase